MCAKASMSTGASSVPSVKTLGKRAEDLAAGYFRDRGYRILHQGYRTRLGEIDLILEDKDREIVFVEVKARSSERYGLPQEAVNPRKQRQIARTALQYLQERGLPHRDVRFDILAIRFCGRRPLFDHITRAFGGEALETL